jgi:hypothetical protein
MNASTASYTKGTFAAYRSIDVTETFKIFVKYSGFFFAKEGPFSFFDLDDFTISSPAS